MPSIPPHLIQLTKRSRHLSHLRTYHDGTQYDGRPDFWTGKKGNGETVPMRERKPAINYKLSRQAVAEIVKFTLGEGRSPRIRVEPDEELAGVSLSATEAKALIFDHFSTFFSESSDAEPMPRRARSPPAPSAWSAARRR